MNAIFNREAKTLQRIAADPLCLVFTSVVTVGAIASYGALGLLASPIIMGGVYLRTLQNRIV